MIIWRRDRRRIKKLSSRNKYGDVFLIKNSNDFYYNITDINSAFEVVEMNYWWRQPSDELLNSSGASARHFRFPSTDNYYTLCMTSFRGVCIVKFCLSYVLRTFKITPKLRVQRFSDDLHGWRSESPPRRYRASGTTHYDSTRLRVLNIWRVTFVIYTLHNVFNV